MEYVTGLLSASDMTAHADRVGEAIRGGSETLAIGALGKSKVVELTRDASVLLANGEAVASGRTALIIDNLDEDVAVALLAADETDVNNAIAYILPGERMVLTFASGNTDAVYGRSMGYSVECRIREV